MDRKIKYKCNVTTDKVDDILEAKWPGKKCPQCHKVGLYAGSIETQYEEVNDLEVVLSFQVFCKQYGTMLSTWDNTNREYFFGKR